MAGFIPGILKHICLLIGFVLVFGDARALAQICSFSISDVDFGNVDLSSGNRVRTTATLTATCTGSRRQRIRICPNLGSGTGGNSASADPRYMVSGANRINYNLFRDGGYSRIWGSHVWPWSPTPPNINLRLNNSGFGTTSRTIRAEIYAGQNSAFGGLYSSSFSGGHTLISYGDRRLRGCRRISRLGGVQVPFTVRANNQGACTVTALDLDFGTTGILSGAVDAANTVSVSCTPGIAYSIGLDGGLTGASDPELRKLTNGPSQVTYGIYRNAARTAPWGNNPGTNTIDFTSTGSIQTFTAYGRVPVQSTPGSGTYTDTIVVTLTY